MILKPSLISGGKFEDPRGALKHFNTFDMQPIKRMYIIESTENQPPRAWQGHQIEQRWFSCLKGAFKIILHPIENWKIPTTSSKPYIFELTEQEPNILHIPANYVSGLKSTESNSQLVVFSDYSLGEINDEYRFPLEQWEI